MLVLFIKERLVVELDNTKLIKIGWVNQVFIVGMLEGALSKCSRS